MSTREAARLLIAACSVLGLVQAADGPKLGRELTGDEVRKVDITVAPDGSGLPPGSGSVAAGAAVYAQKCQACHGQDGAGKPQDQLTGGLGSLASGKPVKTPVSFWPSATTLFDYIRRAMPFNAPRSLSDDEVYALTAYILALNKLIDEQDVMDAKTLPRVKMPNRDNFIIPYPDRI